jgi:ribose transport system ATP-binding protein
MEMHGAVYSPKDPLEANKMGVGMVFQEQSLIQNLTVGQNIFLGQENKYKKLGFVDWASCFS